MPITPITTIKSWFRKKLKPTQAQFWAVFDSFWHKQESIPISSIAYLQEYLDAKADKVNTAVVIVNGHAFGLVKHASNNTIANSNVIELNDIIVNGWFTAQEFWQTAKYIGGNVNDRTSWQVLSRLTEIEIN